MTDRKGLLLMENQDDDDLENGTGKKRQSGSSKEASYKVHSAEPSR